MVSKYVDEIMDIVDNETGELDLEHQRLAIQQQIRKAQLDYVHDFIDFLRDSNDHEFADKVSLRFGHYQYKLKEAGDE